MECGNCGDSGCTHGCSGCRLVAYCNESCQASDFPEHSQWCGLEPELIEGTIIGFRLKMIAKLKFSRSSRQKILRKMYKGSEDDGGYSVKQLEVILSILRGVGFSKKRGLYEAMRSAAIEQIAIQEANE